MKNETKYPVVRGISYSFEDYAAMWGCDPCFDNPPREPGDGYLFYNFGSLNQKRDKEYLSKFLAAIKRTIIEVRSAPILFEEGDLENLQLLKKYIKKLLDNTRDT